MAVAISTPCLAPTSVFRLRAISAAARRFPEPVEYLDLLGSPYADGASGEGGTYDCGGLVDEVLARAGVVLPGIPAVPGTAELVLHPVWFQHFFEVPATNLQPLDLMFCTRAQGPHHIGICVAPGLVIQSGAGHVVTVMPVRRFLELFGRRFLRAQFFRATPGTVAALREAPIEPDCRPWRHSAAPAVEGMLSARVAGLGPFTQALLINLVIGARIA